MKSLTTRQVKSRFGDFDYKEGKGGRIIIDKAWVRKNITRIDLPIVGRTWCHKLIYFDLYRIFYRMELEGIDEHIDKKDFRLRGGCYVPRHMCWNKRRSISTHAWGIAIDLNVSTNPYGSIGTMHGDIIQTFADFGFFWGGLWRTSDPMHFEISNEFKPCCPVLTTNKL